MPITPPTCRTCHQTEWRHTCRGRVEPKALLKAKKAPPAPKVKQKFGQGKRAR